jgi:hypothetical protein
VRNLLWDHSHSIVAVRDSAGQLRLLVSLEPVLYLMSVPTCMLVARGERDAEAVKGRSHLERVLLCLDNAHDLARTLLPGYQVIVRMCA